MPGDILRKTVVNFLSSLCIDQTLWDLSRYNRGNSTFICHLDKNGEKMEKKHLLKKVIKDVEFVAQKKRERKQGRC